MPVSCASIGPMLVVQQPLDKERPRPRVPKRPQTSGGTPRGLTILGFLSSWQPCAGFEHRSLNHWMMKCSGKVCKSKLKSQHTHNDKHSLIQQDDGRADAHGSSTTGCTPILLGGALDIRSLSSTCIPQNQKHPCPGRRLAWHKPSYAKSSNLSPAHGACTSAADWECLIQSGLRCLRVSTSRV